MRPLFGGSGNVGANLCRTLLLPAALGFTRRPDKFTISRRRRLFIIESFHHTTLYLFTKDSLDAVYRILVFAGDEGKGISRLCSASRAADAVRIGIDRVRHIIVDDM
jgi:hypothetical protein